MENKRRDFCSTSVGGLGAGTKYAVLISKKKIDGTKPQWRHATCNASYTRVLTTMIVGRLVVAIGGVQLIGSCASPLSNWA